jgi:hypothetical protein
MWELLVQYMICGFVSTFMLGLCNFVHYLIQSWFSIIVNLLFSLQKMFAYGTKLVDPESQRFAFLLLSVSILKKLLHCSHDVRKLWLCCDSEHNILSALFRALDHCKYHDRT